MGVDDVLDNELETQDPVLNSGFFTTIEDKDQEERKWESLGEEMLDPADMGLEIGSIGDEDHEESDHREAYHKH